MGEKQHSGNWYLLKLAWEMGFTIAIPLVILVVVGVILDRTYHTTPFFIIFGITLSIIVSSYGVYRMMLPAINETKEEEEDSKKVIKKIQKAKDKRTIK